MEEKRSKKKLKDWQCPKGCNVTLKPCKHIEAVLPFVDRGRSSQKLRDELVEHIKLSEGDPEDYERRCKAVEQRLLSLGLEMFRVQLLMDRFISKLTLKEIAQSHGYVSAGAVQYLIKDTLEQLRSRGSSVAKKLLGDYDS